MDEQGMGTLLSEKLALDVRGYDWGVWRKIVESLSGSSHLVKIAVCGKYADLADSYVSVNEALRHAAANCNARVEIEWVETERFENSPAECSILDKFDGVLVPGGFGSRGVEGKIAALKYARENDIPLLGICFGFQLAVVEFARSLGLSDANSTEINPNTAHPVVSLMPEQQRVNLKGATMRLGASAIQITPNTVASALYGRSEVMERHRHRFEVNPLYIEQLESGGGLFSGRSDNGERMEMFELPENSYHVGTQFHGEFKSRPGAPSPPYLGLIKAALNRKLNEAQTVMSD
jgi:CTP synthase